MLHTLRARQEVMGNLRAWTLHREMATGMSKYEERGSHSVIKHRLHTHMNDELTRSGCEIISMRSSQEGDSDSRGLNRRETELEDEPKI